MIALRVPFFESYGHYLEVSGVLIMTVCAGLIMYWLRLDLSSSGKHRTTFSLVFANNVIKATSFTPYYI